MTARSLAFLLVICMASPVAAVAQMTNGSGTYGTSTYHMDSQERDDGTTVQTEHYSMLAFGTKDSPIDNTKADCVGVTVIADEQPVSSSGMCSVSDGMGNGNSFWWRLEDTGSGACPQACGVWGYIDGYGKYAGIKGQGTWRQERQFDSGASGTWTANWSM